MKFIYTIILVLSVLVLGCTTPEAKKPVAAEEITIDSIMSEDVAGTWIEDYQQALKLSKEQNKPILINFTGSDWCGWCKKLMGEVFTKQEFIDYSKANLILLKIDFPSKIQQSADLKKQNNQLQDKFKVKGYPTIVLLDSKEVELGRTGYQPGGPSAYIQHLESFLKK
ncbi:MAG: thioredoxin [Candidatus Cloacimonetes bacterium HGW-Cloacimonetes-1]|jgi:protein disulfide-isomerase|nr:MAG: thioredoxin [Candidatus Cloacimonetes bacterium HGW-Cloacimonetes-1]